MSVHDIPALLSVVFLIAAVVVLVVDYGRWRGGGPHRSAQAVMDIDALFSPARRHQIRQQQVMKLSIDDPEEGGPGWGGLDLDHNVISLKPPTH